MASYEKRMIEASLKRTIQTRGKRKEQNDPYFDPYDVDEDNPFDVDVVPESSEGEIEYPLMAPLNLLQRLISEPSGYDQSQNSGEGASTSQEGTRGESQEPAETTMSPSQSQIRRAFEKVSIAGDPRSDNKRNYRKPDYCLYCKGMYMSKISPHYLSSPIGNSYAYF